MSITETSTELVVVLAELEAARLALACLKKLPIQRIKVDQSFVHNITTTNNNRIITNAVVALGHSLELDVVAEGIETHEQLEHLRQINCPHGQGYYFAPALALQEFINFVRINCADTASAD